MLSAIRSRTGSHALEALITEATRVERHGFTRRARAGEAQPAAGVRPGPRGEGQRRVGAARAEYIRNFLTANRFRHRLGARDAREIPAGNLACGGQRAGKEWNAIAAAWWRVALRSPASPCPRKTDLAAIVKTASAAAVAAYVDDTLMPCSSPSRPRPGDCRERAIAEAGITEWTLSNGARVVLHPTTFKQDEGSSAPSAPRASLVPDATTWRPQRSGQSVGRRPCRLRCGRPRQVLAGKVATVLPFFEESFEGLAAEARRAISKPPAAGLLRFTNQGRPTAFASCWSR